MNQKTNKTEVLNGVTRVLEFDTNDLGEVFYWQGHYHATDRFIQMELLRIIASGRICELLNDDEDGLAIDKFMRTLGLDHYSKLEVQTLDQDTSNYLQSYCDGVNSVISKKIPLVLKALGISYRPWEIKDCIMTVKAMSYLGLAQGQQDLEKFFIELLQKGVPKEKVESLMNGQEKISSELVAILKKTKIYQNIIPSAKDLLRLIPKVQASNNWVVSTEGTTLHSCDPHLECNRLPSVWYEMQLKLKDSYLFGISMPGIPGIVMGRSQDLAFSFTYGFMDTIDYFIEEIRSESYRNEEEFIELFKRKEIIKRKKHHDEKIRVLETRNGVIEYDPSSEVISDGLHLSMAWTCQKDGASKTFKALTDIFTTNHIDQLADSLAEVCISCNWLLSDTKGNIIYQQSGLAPNRKDRGLLPLLGFRKENQWQGFIPGNQLRRDKNPEEGFLVTANNNLNDENFACVINAPMADYRIDYINRELSKKTWTEDFMKKLQASTYSIQAEHFLKRYNKEFSSSHLKDFDCDYNINSEAATDFEVFYKKLLENFISDHLLNLKECHYTLSETCIVTDFYGLFDRLFLSEICEPEYNLWFNSKSAAQYVIDALKVKKDSQIWGEANKIDMNFILFDGKLPAFISRDIRNVPVKGNRATVSQGAVYRTKGRASSFLPSWKMVTTMNENYAFTVLPGGLNDNIFSKFYKSDLQNWLDGSYRKTEFV
ncbi:penicillin acylase family protein [Bacteriovorax sp. Seq25_V]|uniref:penicillin acylase family protein n=1 Tax=Bacteriovorax sp. Seq25_V TaxID=1201288 RepID=UPI00038A0C4E|nr:penicillin acylase family protein [Bacteriovorax sp. Seq25_V]EQC47684.1 penicillin amidase [Bacteriovorax sp. Seq25_V]